MISDEQFAAWLADENKQQCILAEFDFSWVGYGIITLPDGSQISIDPPPGPTTAYLATHAYVSEPSDDPPNQVYQARVCAIPEFAQRMTELFIGRTTANEGKVEITADAALDAWIFERDWIGRGARLRVGDPSWPLADFRWLCTGVTADLQVNDTNRMVFVVRDLQHLLNQPIRVDAMQAGPAAGRPQPLTFGSAYSVPGTLEDAATHRYRFNDGPLSAIANVRTQGGPALTHTPDLFDGCTVITNPNAITGRVTADVTGATYGANPLNNASDLIRHLVTDRGYFEAEQLDAASFATLKAQCPAPLAYFVPTAEVDVYQAVDEVLMTVGAYAAVSREGKYFVKRFDFDGDPVMTVGREQIVEFGLRLTRVLQPVRSIRIAARKNQAVATGDVQVAGGFGAASETEIALSMQPHQFVGAAQNPNAVNYARMRRLLNPGRGGAPLPPSTPLAEEPGTIPSLFVYQADATVEAQRRMGLWGVLRYLFSVTCFITPLRLSLGDAITLVHHRYGLALGKHAVIVGLKERLSAKRVELSVLV